MVTFMRERSMATEWEKPVALVTGASSGIGFELAAQFARHGYDLIIVSCHREALEQAAHALSELEETPRVTHIAADLSRSGAVDSLYTLLMQSDRPIDVLAANAGVGLCGDFARETDLGDELKLLQLNIVSQVHLIKLLVRNMIDRGSGRILITSSTASLMPGPYEAVYAASKAFLRSFGEAIRHELKDTGVSVTVLMPGPTDTQFFARADMLETAVGKGPKMDPAEVARVAFEALEYGSAHVVAGVKNKLQAGLSAMMTDPTAAAIHGHQTKRQH
jgi:short-subunit dehydrogenase